MFPMLERLHYLQQFSTDFEGMLHFYLICMIPLVNKVLKTQSMWANQQHYQQEPSVLSNSPDLTGRI